MTYRNKFERELVEKVAAKSNLSENHIYLIYVSFQRAISSLLKNPLTERVYIPFLGRFTLSVKRCKTLQRKADREIEYFKSKGIDTFEPNYEFLNSLKYCIDKYGKQ